MWDLNEKYAVAHYSNFTLEKENRTMPTDEDDYVLRVGGYYEVGGERPAGDSMGQYDGQKFSHKES